MENNKKKFVFIISTGRAGSNAIYSYLNKMCDLNLPNNNAPHYWIDVEKYHNKAGAILDCYVADYQKYMSLYINSKIALDASVGYFFYIDEFLENLKKKSIEPKIIFLYREPIGRTISHFNQLKKKKMTKFSSIYKELNIKWDKGTWCERCYDNIFYYDVFKKINKNFKDVLLINFKDFKNNPHDELKKIINFLEFQQIKSIDYWPINASSDIYLNKLTDFKISKYVSMLMNSEIKKKSKKLVSYFFYYFNKLFKKKISQKFLENKLKNSMCQYKQFLDYLIKH